MQQRNKPYEGFFITVEGGEGSGKTLLTDKLQQALQRGKQEVVRTREPGGSALSEHLRKLLLDPPTGIKIGERAELLLFLAARAQHLEEIILPALHAGKVVLCERFNDSTIAYQGCARHLGMSFVEALCTLACNITPDLTLFLDLDPALGLQRVAEKRKTKLDRVEQEHLQFHKEVRQGFLHLADAHPDRIRILDASLPPEEVEKAALEALTKVKHG